TNEGIDRWTVTGRANSTVRIRLCTVDRAVCDASKESTRALVASVGEASPSSVRARGERDPPGRLRVHRRAIDVDGAAPGGAGAAVRCGVEPSRRLFVARTGWPG